MATKRFYDESGSDTDQPNEKRMRTRLAFASGIRGVITENFLRKFSSVLEPMLRRVVKEEVEHGLRCRTRSLTRSPSLRIQALEPQPSTLKLIFNKTLLLPIFTGSKIVDPENDPLQIFIVDTYCDQMVQTTLSYPIKVEIVVLDGDFPGPDRETWTCQEFEKNILKERTGKRPLLAGDLIVTVRDGFASVGDIEFTDNSSWIRSRKFRLGARVVQGTGRNIKIREAMTEPFVVKDHRGELYKKHHPPRLEDEVWRLEKIGKEGSFHKKLTSAGIHTVQDFLKLSTVDPSKLRSILGVGMSEKMWEVTLRHAKTCVMGSKLYVSHEPNQTIIMNPVCQVVKAVINGQTYTNRDFTCLNTAYTQNLIREAYVNWNSLEEVDGVMSETPLLTQGDLVDQYQNTQQTMVRSYQQHAFVTNESIGVSMPNNAQVECNDWVVSCGYTYPTPVESGVRFNFSESSSDDMPPTRPFIHEG